MTLSLCCVTACSSSYCEEKWLGAQPSIPTSEMLAIATKPAHDRGFEPHDTSETLASTSNQSTTSTASNTRIICSESTAVHQYHRHSASPPPSRSGSVSPTSTPPPPLSNSAIPITTLPSTTHYRHHTLLFGLLALIRRHKDGA